MKKYLMTEIAPITDEQKVERQLYALYEDEVRRVYFEHDQWLDCETACPVYEAPKFYLPGGLPDPSAAVEVFEAEVEPMFPCQECGGVEAVNVSNWDLELPMKTKVGVFKL